MKSKNSSKNGEFYKRLKKEIPGLVKDGIINEKTGIKILKYYGDSEHPAREGIDKFINGILIVGTGLIGAGIITFVAAHWENLSKLFKLAGLLILMLSAHIGGYYLWKIKGKLIKLGHSLILLGTLIMGANIGLFAQMFHIKSTGSFTEFFLWGIGAAAMAWGIKSIPHSVLAISLFTIWFFGQDANNYLFPLIAAASFYFAYQQKSRIVSWFATTALSIGILGNLLSEEYTRNNGLAFLIGAALLAALYYLIGNLVSSMPPDFSYHKSAFLRPAALIFFGTGLVFSFEESMEDILSNQFEVYGNNQVLLKLLLGLLIAIVLVNKIRKKPIKLLDAKAIIYGTFLLTVFLIACTSSLGSYNWEFKAICLPLALILLNFVLAGAGLFWAWKGARDGRRGIFWAGFLMFFTVAAARFLEYTEDLMVKSLFFLIIGLLILITGLKLERTLCRKIRKESDNA